MSTGTTKMQQSFSNASFRIVKYVVMIAIIVICAIMAFDFGLKVFSNDGVESAPGTNMTITVGKGTTIGDMGDLLEEYNVINNKLVFKVQSMIYKTSEIKPGTYIFNTSKGGEEIFKTIEEGPEELKKVQKGEDID